MKSNDVICLLLKMQQIVQEALREEQTQLLLRTLTK